MTHADFQVREAEEGDAEALLAHSRRILEEDVGMVTEPDEYDLDVEGERRWIRRHHDHPDRLLLVAAAGDRLVGVLDFAAGNRRRLAHQGRFGMSVAREWRRKGVGRALLTRLLAWAEAHPRILKVGLAVLADNEPAIALYRSMGFVEEGRRVAEVRRPDGRLIDDLLMYRLVRTPTPERKTSGESGGV